MGEIIIICSSLLFSAFFSGMEIAYISSNKISLEIEKNKLTFSSKLIKKITQNPSKFITTMLIGNNISLVIYGFSMGEVLSNYFDFSILFQTIISTVIILITAEFFPKVFFQIYSVRFLKLFILPAYIFYILFYFISDFVIWVSDFFLKFFFNSKIDEKNLKFSMIELEHYVNEEIGKVDNIEKIDNEVQIFQNALVFSELKSRDIMIPRVELTSVEIHDHISDLKKLFIETGFSKILVFRNTIDDIIGYVHSFDLFKNPKTLKSILIPVDFVPETILIKDVFKLLTSKKRSIAIVIDEYGGTSGMLTIEDIMEELFGEIDDEFDNLNLEEKKISDKEYHFSARLSVNDLNKKYDLSLPENSHYETLGGLIMSYSEKIPNKNDIIYIDKYKLIITNVSFNRINKISLILS
ncbi:MAG: hemolysin [Flavobacteriaceae bacterium]|mgnify:CR=1 FL=1|jgi:CBS domain containing-hemolysin-like protein|nr:hemolysin [Flavobacteriaceae bacterium]|tara:strand:- start:4554 stop:5783 length:1230 start_codon:yes stop_codon:yes gene_type:complete